MDMPGLAAGVGPQADVGLLGLEQTVDDRCAAAKQRPMLLGFIRSQLRDPGYVSLGLEDERADSQWSDAMLYPPAFGIVD